MPFDPLTWALGFVLTRLSSRLLELSPAGTLRAKLQLEAARWAKQLPPHLSTNYSHIFGDTHQEADPESRPARFRLQTTLCDAGQIPSQTDWLEAFIEHWDVKRLELGDRANSFFQLDPESARTHLAELARRLHIACQGDTPLALRTITSNLEQILSHSAEARAARRRIELTPYYARDLSLKAQALILDRPAVWEYRLFSAVLEHELQLHSSIRRDYEEGALWGKPLLLTGAPELIEWLHAHIVEAEQFGQRAAVLVNERLPISLGPPGVAGDPEAIVDVGKRLGELYRRTIEWSLALYQISTNDQCATAVQLCSRLVENVIREIQDFSAALAEAIHESETNGISTPRTIELTLTLTVPPGVVDELERELARLAEYFKVRPFELL